VICTVHCRLWTAQCTARIARYQGLRLAGLATEPRALLWRGTGTAADATPAYLGWLTLHKEGQHVAHKHMHIPAPDPSHGPQQITTFAKDGNSALSNTGEPAPPTVLLEFT